MTDDSVKVGDQLAFKDAYGKRYHLKTVTKITPSGRITCGEYTLYPNLTIRGNKNHWVARQARRLTPEIKESVRRQAAMDAITRTDLNKIDTASLVRAAEILKHREKP
jgi:hypothetical protein